MSIFAFVGSTLVPIWATNLLFGIHTYSFKRQGRDGCGPKSRFHSLFIPCAPATMETAMLGGGLMSERSECQTSFCDNVKLTGGRGGGKEQSRATDSASRSMLAAWGKSPMAAEHEEEVKRQPHPIPACSRTASFSLPSSERPRHHTVHHACCLWHAQAIPLMAMLLLTRTPTASAPTAYHAIRIQSCRNHLRRRPTSCTCSTRACMRPAYQLLYACLTSIAGKPSV